MQRIMQCRILIPLRTCQNIDSNEIHCKGETRRVSIVLGADAFAFYDVDLHDFRVEPGDFIIMAGGSSSDLPLSSRISVE